MDLDLDHRYEAVNLMINLVIDRKRSSEQQAAVLGDALGENHPVVISEKARLKNNIDWQTEDQPDFVLAARQFWGTEMVDRQSEQIRFGMYQAMVWIYKHRYNILDHVTWRDFKGGMPYNWWKWQFDAKRGIWIELYDDSDWTYYTQEEILLLQKELVYEKKTNFRTRMTCYQ